MYGLFSSPECSVPASSVPKIGYWRWVGSCRRDLLDHVIVLNERHLKRLIREYIRYYHEDRTHLALAKDTPIGRSSSCVGDSHCGYQRAGRTPALPSTSIESCGAELKTELASPYLPFHAP